MQQNRQWLKWVRVATVVAVWAYGVGWVFAAPAPVERSGQTHFLFPGDDGDIQAGVALPTPRFTDHLNGTVTDNLTGLIWLKNANCFGSRTWGQAMIDVNTLANGRCGLMDGSVAGDWRLPNIKELQSLIHFGYADPALSNVAGTGQWSGGLVCSGVGDAFPGLEAGGYWSSTTVANDKTLSVRVRMNSGANVLIIKGTTEFVWAVRGPIFSAPAPVEQSGQTRSFFSRDDGGLKAGIALPTPRFTDRLNGTVTDNLTGLIWLKNANCFGSKTWEQTIIGISTLANGSCGLTDGSVAGSWRLPNVREMQSLVQWGFGNPTLSNAAGTGQWTEGNAFSRVQSAGYWTSTSKVDIPPYAWRVLLNSGTTTVFAKKDLSFGWPVRDP